MKVTSNKSPEFSFLHGFENLEPWRFRICRKVPNISSLKWLTSEEKFRMLSAIFKLYSRDTLGKEVVPQIMLKKRKREGRSRELNWGASLSKTHPASTSTLANTASLILTEVPYWTYFEGRVLQLKKRFENPLILTSDLLENPRDINQASFAFAQGVKIAHIAYFIECFQVYYYSCWCSHFFLCFSNFFFLTTALQLTRK